jgi:hypothetical protein
MRVEVHRCGIGGLADFISPPGIAFLAALGLQLISPGPNSVPLWLDFHNFPAVGAPSVAKTKVTYTNREFVILSFLYHKN